jgi:uncharacterized protein
MSEISSLPFHLSFFVADMDATRAFYGGVLGCAERNLNPSNVDFYFYGNQLTCHVAPERVRAAAEVGFDGNHFGAIITSEQFDELEAKLRSAGVTFLAEPETQRRGTPGERRRMVFTDPSGNPIEMKGYADIRNAFSL